MAFLVMPGLVLICRIAAMHGFVAIYGIVVVCGTVVCSIVMVCGIFCGTWFCVDVWD